MKILIIAAILLFHYTSVLPNSWILKGNVVDESNNDVIINVNIYIANSTIGTTSDTDGKFEIKMFHISFQSE